MFFLRENHARITTCEKRRNNDKNSPLTTSKGLAGLVSPPPIFCASREEHEVRGSRPSIVNSLRVLCNVQSPSVLFHVDSIRRTVKATSNLSTRESQVE